MENKFALPVFITERARAEVKAIMDQKKIAKGYALRLGVRGGGCSGVSYVIGFDKPKNTDDVFDAGEFNVLIEKKHTMYLIGLKVDFVDSVLERGFSFQLEE